MSCRGIFDATQAQFEELKYHISVRKVQLMGLCQISTSATSSHLGNISAVTGSSDDWRDPDHISGLDPTAFRTSLAAMESDLLIAGKASRAVIVATLMPTESSSFRS